MISVEAQRKSKSLWKITQLMKVKLEQCFVKQDMFVGARSGERETGNKIVLKFAVHTIHFSTKKNSFA